MLTYNQIIKISRAFQQAHHVLKNFGNGGEWDKVVHNQQPTYKYPLMWMDDLPSSLSDGSENYSFRVSFSAPVVTLKDRDSDLMSTNVNEVKSDMIQCANSFIAYWVNQTDNYQDLVLEKSISRTTFEDLTDDKLTGCYIDITFRQSFDYNVCILPIGTPIALPDTCAPVLIFEDGVLVDTIASGGTYSYTTGGGSAIAQVTNSDGSFTDSFDTADNPYEIPDSPVNFNGSPLVPLPATITKSIEVYNNLTQLVGTVLQDTITSALILAPDGIVNVRDSANNLLFTLPIPSGVEYDPQVSDSIVSNSDDSYTVNVLSQQNLELPDTTINVTVNGIPQTPETFPTLTPNQIVNINVTYP